MRTPGGHHQIYETEQYPQADSAQVFTIPGTEEARPPGMQRRVVRLSWSPIVLVLLAVVVALLVLYVASTRSRGAQPQQQGATRNGRARGATPTSTPPRTPRHLPGAARPRHRTTLARQAPVSKPEPEPVETQARTYRVESTPVAAPRSPSVEADSGNEQTGGLFSP